MLDIMALVVAIIACKLGDIPLVVAVLTFPLWSFTGLYSIGLGGIGLEDIGLGGTLPCDKASLPVS